MIIVGLLLVALGCLAAGLLLPSTAWLIASLIASAGAGYVLWRARTLIAGGAHAADAKTVGAADVESSAEATDDSSMDSTNSTTPDSGTETRVAARRRSRAAKAAGHSASDEAAAGTQVRGGELLADLAPGGTASAVDAEGDVWVIDGRPRYHLSNCAIIQGQDAEPIPFEQATEDGFMPCSLCEPNVARSRERASTG
ncbi:MAG: hypothetical protein QOG80_2243 [Pseudonocardiales bacterium]|jgi:hypothetical protein|nr:hypothetical protein [Pseudonocardiales bacterium]